MCSRRVGGGSGFIWHWMALATLILTIVIYIPAPEKQQVGGG